MFDKKKKELVCKKKKNIIKMYLIISKNDYWLIWIYICLFIVIVVRFCVIIVKIFILYDFVYLSWLGEKYCVDIFW